MDIAKLGLEIAKLGAPILGTALGGPAGGAVAKIALDALAEALGTEPTPEAVAKEVASNPVAQAVIRTVEQEHGPGILDEMIKDRMDARATMVKQTESGSWTGMAPAILTGLNTVAFYGVLGVLIFKGLPDTGARELVSGMIGAIVGSYIASNNFWFGSSPGSKQKDSVIATLAKR
jgi:hypothetical protein